LITITRHVARRLRSVFRRSALGIAHRGAIPPLVLHAEGRRLRAQYRYEGLAVEHVEPRGSPQLDSIPVPLEALADVEGREVSEVEIESVDTDRIVVRWRGRGIPRSREYPVTPFGRVAVFPATPADWSTVPAGLLDALAEAAGICTDDSARYALDCIQLRGKEKRVVASDGRQLLIRSDITFPWDGDVLIEGAPIFASRSLPRDQPVRVARSETHVVFRVGPWTTYHEIRKDGRFPDVEGAVPDEAAVQTRLRIDPEDARFLVPALERLPGAEVLYSPATVDLNGEVAVRAGGDGSAGVAELVLSRSSYTGTPVRINVNRAYLGRAIGLGFREIGIADVESPVVCRGPGRVYAWQPLDAEAAIGPAEGATRIESSPSNGAATRIESCPPNRAAVPVSPPRDASRRTMSEPRSRNGHEPVARPEAGGQANGEMSGKGLADLIHDAEALHTSLTEARTSVARLIAGLRRHRKQSRHLSDALKSLRQLRLGEVAER
jgi:hypothetical protein